MNYSVRYPEVEAFQWKIDPEPTWFKKAIEDSCFTITDEDIVINYTLQGVQRAAPKDWIVFSPYLADFEFLIPTEFHYKYYANNS